MKKIVGIFSNEESAVRAIEDLQRQGYSDDEISVITEDKERFEAIKNRTGLEIEDETDGSGVAAGATAGGAIGGLGGLLLGLGALAIPGVGPIVAAGPIASALVGALAGGAVGGLAGALVDYGVSEDDAKVYADRINQGDIMVLVDDPDDDARRETVYDNFRRNDSFNKDSYTHADTLTTSPYQDRKLDDTRAYTDTSNNNYNAANLNDSKIDPNSPTYNNDTNLNDTRVGRNTTSPIEDDYKNRNTTTEDPLVTDTRNTYNSDDPLNPDNNERKY